MDGQVSGLGTVHPLLTLSFFSTWILPLHVVCSPSYFVFATWRYTCAFGMSYFDDEYDRAAAL